MPMADAPSAAQRTPNDPRCPRCGAALRVERVKVLVQRECDDAPVTFSYYEERDEVSDCPRCTGSY